MMTAFLVVGPVLAILQCSLVDVVASHLLPAFAARVVVCVATGVTANALAAPVFGRGRALLPGLLLAVISVGLPTGWGLSGLVLIPFACLLLKSEPFKEKTK